MSSDPKDGSQGKDGKLQYLEELARLLSADVLKKIEANYDSLSDLELRTGCNKKFGCGDFGCSTGAYT